MQMQQVQYFLALCQERNFTRAARRCAVTQPTPTIAIRQLETEFGGSLFKRKGRISTLSGLGLAVRPHLEAVDAAVGGAKRVAVAFLAASAIVPHLRPQPGPLFKPEENTMRKIAIVASVASGLFLVTWAAIRVPYSANASSPAVVSSATDVYTLESTVNVKALPTIDPLSEAEE
jgi:Bacterial regulatory helix-turn-helix protein, lysR family